MRRCVIVGGADINDYKTIAAYFRRDDFFIFCDCGLRHCENLGILPDLIIGDFDSYQKPDTDIETIILPVEKDDTDTSYAVKEGIKRGFDDFLIVGAVGARVDHSLVNIYLLLTLYNTGKNAVLIDDYSEMSIIGRNKVFIEDSFPYFSLVNISGIARGITIENAKYLLNDAEISCNYQYGVSNEVMPGKKASVCVKEGNLLLIKDR